MGKRIENAYKTVNKDQAYSLAEAVKIVKANATAKFDETIDLAINLGVDPKYADQMVRGVCALPNGSGKKVLFIATEQTIPEIQKMILAYLTGFNESKFRYGNFSNKEIQVLH